VRCARNFGVCIASRLLKIARIALRIANSFSHGRKFALDIHVCRYHASFGSSSTRLLSQLCTSLLATSPPSFGVRVLPRLHQPALPSGTPDLETRQYQILCPHRSSPLATQQTTTTCLPRLSIPRAGEPLRLCCSTLVSLALRSSSPLYHPPSPSPERLQLASAIFAMHATVHFVVLASSLPRPSKLRALIRAVLLRTPGRLLLLPQVLLTPLRSSLLFVSAAPSNICHRYGAPC
jgi:hypothetical protein